jgi:CheY-like chemotaxis protein
MILVVDDERSLADTMVAMLELIGQRSTAAYNAEDAVEMLRKEEPTLLISDVVMPGANGVQLAIQARVLWPKVKILLMSGNAATQDIIESALDQGHAFELLAKPIPPKQMLMKVVSLLTDEPGRQHRCVAAGAS